MQNNIIHYLQSLDKRLRVIESEIHDIDNKLNFLLQKMGYQPIPKVELDDLTTEEIRLQQIIKSKTPSDTSINNDDDNFLIDRALEELEKNYFIGNI